MIDNTRKPMTIVILQETNTMELKNAIDIANASQGSFQFDLYPEVVQVEKEIYELPNKAFDLGRAIADLVKHKTSIRKLLQLNLVFVTSLPFSDTSLVNDFPGKLLLDELSQCYFYEVFKYSRGNVSLISTYIWEHLPSNKFINFPITPSGRRAIQPYFLFEFASIALDPHANLAFHEEIRGCPFDYCNDVHDIDEAFRVRKICAEHKDFLQEQINMNNLTKEQFNSVINLFNRAFGKIAIKNEGTINKNRKAQIQYNFNDVKDTTINIISPGATASIEIVRDTKDVILQLIEIFQSANFEDEKYKQQSIEILHSILEEIQKPDPKKFSIEAMVSNLSNLVSLAMSINNMAPKLLEMIRKYW